MTPTLIVLAKRPVPGRVKTRLVPPFSYEQAAAIAGAALSDTLMAVADAHAQQRILAFDGDARDWLPAGWRHVPQVSGGLDVRLARAIEAAGTGPALLVGMDTPQLRPEQLERFDHERYDACLGLAPDGGYWAIGLRDPALARAAILGVPMSTTHTGAAQLRQLIGLGLRVQLLEPLVDVDTVDDARLVADAAPHTRFAAAFTAALAAIAVDSMARAG